MTAIEKLLKLADDAERQAAAYRLAAAALNGHAQVTRTARAATVLDAALEVDAKRRQGKRKPAPGDATRRALATRERTAKLLEALERGPMTLDECVEAYGGRVPYGPLMHVGLIKKIGGGKYKRTAKPFAVDWRQNPTP